MRKVDIVLKNGAVKVNTEIPDLDALDLPAIFLCTNEEYKRYLDDRTFIAQVITRWDKEAEDTAATLVLTEEEKQEAIVAYGLPQDAADEQVKLSVAKGTNFSNYLLRRISDERFQSQFSRALARLFPSLVQAELVRVTFVDEEHYLSTLNMDVGDLSILIARLMTIAYSDQPVAHPESTPEPQITAPKPPRIVTPPHIPQAKSSRSYQAGYYEQEPIAPSQVLAYRPATERAIVISNQDDPFGDN